MFKENPDFNEAQVLMKYENIQAINDDLRVQGGPREGVREIETNQHVGCRLHYYNSEYQSLVSRP